MCHFMFVCGCWIKDGTQICVLFQSAGRQLHILYVHRTMPCIIKKAIHILYVHTFLNRISISFACMDSSHPCQIHCTRVQHVRCTYMYFVMFEFGQRLIALSVQLLLCWRKSKQTHACIDDAARSATSFSIRLSSELHRERDAISLSRLFGGHTHTARTYRLITIYVYHEFVFSCSFSSFINMLACVRPCCTGPLSRFLFRSLFYFSRYAFGQFHRTTKTTSSSVDYDFLCIRS